MLVVSETKTETESETEKHDYNVCIASSAVQGGTQLRNCDGRLNEQKVRDLLLAPGLLVPLPPGHALMAG